VFPVCHGISAGTIVNLLKREVVSLCGTNLYAPALMLLEEKANSNFLFL
jgi:hypothetical protein